MRILLATNHSYLPQRVGGLESSTHDLCLTLSELGHTVGVLCSLVAWPPIRPLHRLGIAWRGRGSFVRDNLLGYPVFRVRDRTAAISAVVREFMPDAAIIQGERQLDLAAHFRTSNVPCVVYIRDAHFDRLGPVSKSPEVLYIVVSQFLAERFDSEFRIAPLRIPPLVRPERYEVTPERKHVVFVCPHRNKGLEVAFSLAARRPDIPFVFGESWPLRAEHRRALTRRIRHAGNITFRRWSLDVRPLYRSAKVILVPSLPPYAEGWARVASEAQVSGIPVLARKAGGLAESVGDGGILVDGDAQLSNWEAALARMWDDPAEYARLSALALEHSRRTEFQPAAIAGRLVSVLSAHHHRWRSGSQSYSDQE